MSLLIHCAMKTKNLFLKSGIYLSLLAFLVPFLFGCSLHNVQDRQKANAAFDEFTNTLFQNQITANTLNLHYTLTNPEAYGITDYPITLGTFSLDAMEKGLDTVDHCLDALEQISYGALSSDRQLTYDCIYEKLTTEQLAREVLPYTELLSATTGFQAQLPVLLAEYTFADKKDVEDYLTLLTKVRPYFGEIVEFEQQKAKEGLFMPSFAVEDIVAQCSALIANRENHFLITTFESRLNALKLSKDEKENYQKQNTEYLNLYVFPAYEDLITGLTALKGQGTNPYGLCHYEKGRQYYRYLVAANTGSSSSVEELHTRLLSALSAYVGELSSIIKEHPTLPQTLSSGAWIDPITGSSLFADSNPRQNETPAPSSTIDPQSYVQHLQEKIRKDFPTLFHVSYTMHPVDPCLEEYLSPAFYLTPALDAPQNNVIYINYSHAYTPLSLYTTLAHEGFPGHLYQNVYTQSLGQDNVRTLFGTTGYSEGWATYGEMLAYDYAEIDTVIARYYRLNSQISLALSAILDIGIHYYYWTPEDAMDFLSAYGITSQETISRLYAYIVEEPANYLNYAVGYLEFVRLRELAEKQLGEDFSLKDFHESILNIGEAPFSVVEKYLKKQLKK